MASGKARVAIYLCTVDVVSQELEKESLQMADRQEAIRAEKESLLRELVEAERQIMAWEKKTQLAIEARQAVDKEIGQGEIKAMKKEIHRMEVRVGALKQLQEKLIGEMEKAVSRRETIWTRSEAQKAIDSNQRRSRGLQMTASLSPQAGSYGNQGGATRGALHNQIAQLRRPSKTRDAEGRQFEQELQTAKAQQEGFAKELDERRANCGSLQRSLADLDAQLVRIAEGRDLAHTEAFAAQRRLKQLDLALHNKYIRLPASAQTAPAHSAADALLLKQTDRMHSIQLLTSRLEQEVPALLPLLRPVAVLLNARAAEGTARTGTRPPAGSAESPHSAHSSDRD